MKKLKLYTVIKASTDGTFEVGDIVWLSDNNDLNSVRGKGWLSKEEWDVPDTNDFEVTECKTHYLNIDRGIESVRKIPIR